MEHCKKTKGPHGKCPIFIDNKYEWTDVEVVDFDIKSDKFTVNILENGSIK